MNFDPHFRAGAAARHGVSVIIPCYNQARFLTQAIDSVLAQSVPGLEVLVINDGSPDDTAGVAARHGNRIKYIEQTNQGLSSARNTGLRHATGEFIHFLDADDYVLPNFYEHLLGHARVRPDAAAVYSGFQWVDVAGQKLGQLPPETEFADPFHRLLEGNPFPCHSLLLRAAALSTPGTFDPRLRSCEDWDLWLRLAMVGGKFAPVPDFVGVCYRKHPQSMSGNPWTMLEAGMKVISLNARRHHWCPQCKTSTATGQRYWRNLCFQEKIIPGIEPTIKQGRLGRYLRGCARALTYDPPSALRGLQLLRYQKRRILTRVTGTKPF